jgi:mannose-6-phosphate isomerase-like protein (cupin superfamily)
MASTDRPTAGGTRAKKVAHADLELLDIKVTRDGGAVRYLEGAQHGLELSIFESEIVPGSGPPAHSHPYVEVFVLQAGRGRFTVDDEVIDAEPGDIVIVPSGSWHSFLSTGEGALRQVAIHDGPRFEETLRDEPAGRS